MMRRAGVCETGCHRSLPAQGTVYLSCNGNWTVGLCSPVLKEFQKSAACCEWRATWKNGSMITPANAIAALLMLIPFLGAAFFSRHVAGCARRLPEWAQIL